MMELTLQTRMERFYLRIRLSFWRTVSACIAVIMRAPLIWRAFLTTLPILIFAALAYVLGRATGNLLSDYLR